MLFVKTKPFSLIGIIEDLIMPLLPGEVSPDDDCRLIHQAGSRQNENAR